MPYVPRNKEIVQCDPGGPAQGFVDLDLGGGYKELAKNKLAKNKLENLKLETS